MNKFNYQGWVVDIWFDRSIRLWTATLQKGDKSITEYSASRDYLLIGIGQTIVNED